MSSWRTRSISESTFESNLIPLIGYGECHADRVWRHGVAARLQFSIIRFGPVLLVALRRFAKNCFSEAMMLFAHQLGRSVICSHPGAPGVDPPTLAVEMLEPRPDIFLRVSSQSPLAISSALIFKLFPPCSFIAGLMQLSIMAATKRYSELIADFHA